MADYLEMRRRGWYFVIDIPAKLRAHFDGKRRHVQSLQTDSRSVALVRVKPLIAQWKNEFHSLTTGSAPLSNSFLTNALEWRGDLKAANDNQHLREILVEALDERVADVAKKSPEQAATLRGLVLAEFIQTVEHLDEYISLQRQRVAAKTAEMRQSDIIEFAKVFPTTEKISRQAVKRWASNLEANGMKPATIGRKLGAVRGYWSFLQDIEAIRREDDPFSEAYRRSQRQPAKKSEDKRRAFTAAQVLALLRAAEAKKKPDNKLADLIRLAMWSGCRIEQLCALKVVQVLEHSVIVEDAKTEKGNREVPIHPELAPIMERLLRTSCDGYVLSGLTFNKYGDRSNAIGKRFGKLKKAEGFGPEHVFHSIRKTVITLLENAEVPEGVVADIVGHEKQTMSYGLYSDGSTLRRKAEALSHLAYEGWNAHDAHPQLSVTA